MAYLKKWARSYNDSQLRMPDILPRSPLASILMDAREALLKTLCRCCIFGPAIQSA